MIYGSERIVLHCCPSLQGLPTHDAKGEELMDWKLFWQICLFVSLTAFGAMAVIVTIGGAVDIRRMLQKLRDTTEKDDTY